MLFKENQPAPASCGAKQVLIEVKAAAINPVDYKENILFRNIFRLMKHLIENTPPWHRAPSLSL